MALLMSKEHFEFMMLEDSTSTPTGNYLEVKINPEMFNPEQTTAHSFLLQDLKNTIARLLGYKFMLNEEASFDTLINNVYPMIKSYPVIQLLAKLTEIRPNYKAKCLNVYFAFNGEILNIATVGGLSKFDN